MLSNDFLDYGEWEDTFLSFISWNISSAHLTHLGSPSFVIACNAVLYENSSEIIYIDRVVRYIRD